MGGLLYMNRKIFVFLLIFALFLGCNDNDKVADDISKINIDFKVLRFDVDCAKAGPEDIPSLKGKYPYLFPPQYSDSVWAAKLTDTLQEELFSEVGKKFPDFSKQSEALETLFKHAKYYFPRVKVPKVITLTSEVDYNNRVILADSLLLIGLDNYLGPSHRFYQGLPNYVSNVLDEKYLVSDVAGAFAKAVVPKPDNRSFLAHMIYYGKELYLKDKLMPSASDSQKMGYNKDQMAWVQANEEPIWRNFIENEYLYNTDTKLALRFLDPAPFSKFGLELDNESPGRVGRYIGWKIVRAYMEKNTIAIEQLMHIPSEEIFKKSNYKPEK